MLLPAMTRSDAEIPLVSCALILPGVGISRWVYAHLIAFTMFALIICFVGFSLSTLVGMKRDFWFGFRTDFTLFT